MLDLSLVCSQALAAERKANYEDCGECVNCKDKKKFGGPGIKKKTCSDMKPKSEPTDAKAASKLVAQRVAAEKEAAEAKATAAKAAAKAAAAHEKARKAPAAAAAASSSAGKRSRELACLDDHSSAGPSWS